MVSINLWGRTQELIARAKHYVGLKESYLKCHDTSNTWAEDFAQGSGALGGGSSTTSNPPLVSTAGRQPRDLVAAFLHDNPLHGYSSHSLVWQDDHNVLNIARALADMFICLKIWYVKEVDQAWNISVLPVKHLKAWVKRQLHHHK